MPKHSISEAAKLAGVSRSHFYKKFIRPGGISVEKDKDDNPVIDTSEIMRVFGGIHQDTSASVSKIQTDTPENDIKNTALQVEIQLLREQLTAAQERERIANERENRLMNQIDQLTTAIRFIEHKPMPEPPSKKRWWSFS